MNNRYSQPIRTLLALDAASCAVMGAALLVASHPIAALTLIPEALLTVAGASLLPIALFMAVCARARRVPRWAVQLIIWGNFLWSAVSILLPLSALIEPNATGWTLLVGQAAMVSALAVLEARASASPSLQS